MSVLGVSLGGTLALLMELEREWRIEKLILMAPLYSWFETQFPFVNPFTKPVARFLVRFDWARIFFYRWWRRLAMKKIVPDVFSVMPSDDKTRWLVQEVLVKIADRYDRHLSRRALAELTLSVFDVDLTKQLKDVGTPTLVLWGKEDTAVAAKNGPILLTYLPHAKLVEFDEAGHELVIEKPDQVAEEIRDFFAETG